MYVLREQKVVYHTDQNVKHDTQQSTVVHKPNISFAGIESSKRDTPQIALCQWFSSQRSRRQSTPAATTLLHR